MFATSLQEAIAAGQSVTIDEIGEFQTMSLFPEDLSSKHSNKTGLTECLRSKLITFIPSDKLKNICNI